MEAKQIGIIDQFLARANNTLTMGLIRLAVRQWLGIIMREI